MSRSLSKKLLKYVKEKAKLVANPIEPCLPALLDGHEISERLELFSKELLNRKKSLPTISAVYRVKNVEHSLYMSVMSLAPLCTEIIIVDNNSSDNTLCIVDEIKAKLVDIGIDVKLYSYASPIARYGKNYSNTLKNDPSLSIARYYNYAFSKATSQYVIKADADNLYIPNRLRWLQRVVNKNPDAVFYEGLDVAGRMISSEPRLYLKNKFQYLDGEKFEYLDVGHRPIKIFRSYRPVYLHLRNGYRYLA